jgi:hypothetical protein
VRNFIFKAAVAAMALVCISLFIMHGAFAKSGPDINSIQEKYIPYGLIPLTECPDSSRPNYRLWQEACQAIKDMDKDISSDPAWQTMKNREIYMSHKLDDYKCNYMVKQFNLGEYGNRYYSIFSGPMRNGCTVWKSGAWFLYNPTNPKDIGPHKKYFGEMRFSVTGSTLHGEYRMQNGAAASFEGMLRDDTITYTLTAGERGKAKEGSLTIRTPLYLFGTWIEQPGSPKEHRGEWDFARALE